MEKYAKIILGSFVAAVLLLSLVIPLDNAISKNTRAQTITNDAIELSTTTNLTLRGNTITSLVVWNGTNGTIKTNYNFSIRESTGIGYALLALNDTTWKSTPLYANYTYNDPSMYITDSNSRTLIGLGTIFFVLGVLGIILYYNKEAIEGLF